MTRDEAKSALVKFMQKHCGMPLTVQSPSSFPSPSPAPSLPLFVRSFLSPGSGFVGARPAREAQAAKEKCVSGAQGCVSLSVGASMCLCEWA